MAADEVLSETCVTGTTEDPTPWSIKEVLRNVTNRLTWVTVDNIKNRNLVNASHVTFTGLAFAKLSVNQNVHDKK